MQPPPGVSPTTSVNDATPTHPLSTIAATLTSTLTNSVFTTTLTTTPTPTAKPASNGECELLGPFAILIQSSLGVAALLALVFKRYRERPQRPLKIWFFDVSKQLFGGVCVHIANLLMSMLSSGQFSLKVEPGVVTAAEEVVQKMRRAVGGEEKYVPNPCSFYLLNLAIDTTIGIPILIFLLRLLTRLFALTSFGVPRESIESGHYGSPPRTWWWFKQSIIYFLGLMGMKFCVLVIFLVLPIISRVGDYALSWTEGNEALQVVFVMLIFPVTMNAIQYYIIDTYIKQKVEEREIDSVSVDGSDGTRREVESDDEGQGVREALIKQDLKKMDLPGGSSPNLGMERKGSPMSPLRRGHGDYDPLRDGESSPVVAATSGNETERLMPRRSSEGDR